MLRLVPLSLRIRCRGVVLLVATLLIQAFTAAENEVAPVELFEFGDFALYIPPGIPYVRGILVCLGGPDTRAYGLLGRFGAPNPELEASQQILGHELRTLAIDNALAILGTSIAGMG